MSSSSVADNENKPAPIGARAFELDLLRFIAALSVVLYHLTYRRFAGATMFPEIDAITRYGYLGVDLFFIISGFVILWSAKGRSPSQFLVSRFTRLYPLYWMCLVITVAVLMVCTNRIFQPLQLLANTTMLAGYLGQDYVDGVYWTLQVELKFYALIFCLILLRQMNNLEHWLVGWLLLSVLDVSPYAISALRMITLGAYAPYFIAGGALFLARTEGVTPKRLAIVLACAVLSIVNSHHQADEYLFRGDDGVPAVLVGGLYLVTAVLALGLLKIKESSALITLSMTTYPFYLLHSEIGKAIYAQIGLNRYAAVAITILFCWFVSYCVMRLDRPVSAYLRKLLLAKLAGRTAKSAKALPSVGAR